jgi:F-type H+-transporting ATPase subunit alpha
LTRGARLVEILKQPQYSPLPVEKQVVIVYAGTSGVLDDLPLDKLKLFEGDLYRFIDNAYPAIFSEIREKKELSDDLKKTMNSALKEFKDRFVAEHVKK